MKVCNFNLFFMHTAFVFASLYASALFGQSPERISSDLMNGSLTSPDSFDYVLYFATTEAGTVEGTGDLKQAVEGLQTEAIGQKDQAESLVILRKSLQTYIRAYKKAVSEHQKKQILARAAFIGETQNLFEFVAGEDLRSAIAEAAKAVAKKFPELQRSPEALYDLAEILSVVSPDTVENLVSKIIKKHKSSPIIPKAKLLLATAMMQGGKVQAAAKMFAPLKKAREPSVAAYARYKFAWASILLAQEKPDRLLKARAIVVPDLQSVLSDMDEADAAPSVSYLSKEATQDLVQYLGDIGGVDVAIGTFSQNKGSLADVHERTARMLVRTGRLTKAIVQIKAAIEASPFSPFAPARQAYLGELLFQEKKYRPISPVFEKMAKAYLTEKSPWVQYHRGNEDLVKAVRVAILSQMAKMAVALDEVADGQQAAKAAATRLARLYISSAGEEGEKKTQSRIARILSQQKDYKAAADAYFKIAVSAKPQSSQRKTALKSGLLSLDQLYKSSGILEFKPKPAAVPPVAKSILTYNEQYVAEFADDPFASERKLSSAEIYFRYGHNEDAEKLLLSIMAAKDEGLVQRKGALVLVRLYKGLARWPDAAKFAKIVLASPEGAAASDLKVANEALVQSSLIDARKKLDDKDYNAAIDAYEQVMSQYGESSEVEDQIKQLASSLKSKSRTELLIKLAEAGTKSEGKSSLYKFLLTELTSIYELIGDLEKSQAARTRLIKIFLDDPSTPNQMYRYGRVAAAMGNGDLAALSLMALAKKYPKSDLGLRAAVEAGDLYVKLENPKKAAEAFEWAAKNPREKRRDDSLKAMASAYAYSGKMKSGLEKQTMDVAKALAKLPPMIRTEVGRNFLGRQYDILRALVDKEVDESFSDLPLAEYIKVKQVRIKMIEQVFSVIKIAGVDEFILVGNFELGRVWAEYERLLKNLVVDNKKQREAIKDAKKSAAAKSSRYLGQVVKKLDSVSGAFAVGRNVQEGLAIYLKRPSNGMVLPILKPSFSQHLMGFK